MRFLMFSIQTIFLWLICCCALVSPLYAQEPTPDDSSVKMCVPQGTTLTEKFLSCIQQYTNGILQKTNMLPDYIKAANAYFLNWMSTDETDKSIVPDLQSNLTILSNEYTNIATGQKDQQNQIVTDFFKDPADVTGKKAIEKSQLPNANDLAYQSLLGISYFNPDPRKEYDPSINPPRNYMANAAALNIQHVIPNPQWRPKEDIQRQRYFNYYNTVSAVQTYNGYILSQLYADYQNKFALNDMQKKLVDQVTGSDWLTQVGSDNLGLVLRHILMFDSQMFILLTRLLEVERQMLISQAMTNSLLVAVNLGNEDTLVKKANGTLSIP